MKKLTVLLIAIVVISVSITSKTANRVGSERIVKIGMEPIKEIVKTTTKNKIQKNHLIIEDIRYTVLTRKLQTSEDVSLIPNFEETFSSADVLSSEHCDFIINGGFYTRDNSPLGLFFLKREKLSNYVRSDFLNGNISKNRNGKIILSSGTPTLSDDLEFALQSGPFFSLKNGSIQKFENEKARRSLVAQNLQGEIYFLAVYESSDTFSGPDLNTLKKVLLEVSNRDNLQIVSAVNLDGGSTLAFLQTGEDSISEIKKSGSFFCVKNR